MSAGLGSDWVTLDNAKQHLRNSLNTHPAQQARQSEDAKVDPIITLLELVAVDHGGVGAVQQVWVTEALWLVNYQVPNKAVADNVVMGERGWALAAKLCMLGGNLRAMQLGRAIVERYSLKPVGSHTIRLVHGLRQTWNWQQAHPYQMALCDPAHTGILLGTGTTVTCNRCRARIVEMTLRDG